MSLQVGQAVSVKGNPGIVKFVGKTQFAPGEWVGVELDQPVGKNNGSVNGVTYFECKQDRDASKKFGVFVTPALIVPATGTSNDLEQQRARSVVEKLQNKLQGALAEIKQHKTEIEALNSQLADCQAQLEQTIVDRDFLRNENITLNENLTRLQKKYDDITVELAQAYEELEVNKAIESEIRDQLDSESLDGLDAKELLMRQRKLELALISFQNISAQNEMNLKTEIENLRSKQTAGQLTAEDYSAITAKLEIAEQTIASLKAQLDSISDAESIIERLTSENDSLGVELAKLRKNVDELNEVIELDKELEANQNQVEHDLRLNIKQLNHTIEKERDSRRQLELELDHLKKSKLADGQDNPSERLSRLMEDSELKIRAAQREKGYIQLLLDISRAKIDVYEASTKFDNMASVSLRAYEAELKQIISAVCKVRSEDQDFEQGLQVEVFLHSIQWLTSITDALCEMSVTVGNDADRFVHALLGPTIDTFLQHFENRTLHSFDPNGTRTTAARLEEWVRALGPDQTNKAVLNRLLLLHISYEITVGKLKLNTIRGIVSCDERLQDQKLRQDLDRLLEFLDKIEEKCEHALQFHSRVQEVDQLIELSKAERDLLQFQDFDQFLLDSSLYEDDSLDYTLFSKSIESLLATLSSILNSLEVEIKSVKVPIKQPAKANDKVTNADQFENKDQCIKDLELTVSLLTNNISTLTSHHKESLAKVQNELDKVKLKYSSIEEDRDALLKKNKKLEEELQATLSSAKYFDLSYISGKFNSLESEKSFVSSVALMEEITFLRSLVIKEAVEEDLSFLEKPLIPASSDEPHFLNFLGKTIRDIAKTAKLMDMREPYNYKYHKLALDEQVHNYENMRNRVLSL